MDFLSVKIVNNAIKTLLLFLIVVNIGAGLLAPLLAIHITTSIVGATLITVGIATTIYAISKSFFQLLISKKLDEREGEKDDFYSLIIGGVIGVAYFFVFLFIDKIWHLYALQFFIGIGDALLMAAYYAIFSHHIDKETQGFEWSLFSVWGLTISTAIGSLIGGIIAEKFGFDWIFILAGSFNLIALILIIILFPSMLILRKSENKNTIVHKMRRLR